MLTKLKKEQYSARRVVQEYDQSNGLSKHTAMFRGDIMGLNPHTDARQVKMSQKPGSLLPTYLETHPLKHCWILGMVEQ